MVIDHSHGRHRDCRAPQQHHPLPAEVQRRSDASCTGHRVREAQIEVVEIVGPDVLPGLRPRAMLQAPVQRILAHHRAPREVQDVQQHEQADAPQDGHQQVPLPRGLRQALPAFEDEALVALPANLLKSLAALAPWHRADPAISLVAVDHARVGGALCFRDAPEVAQMLGREPHQGALLWAHDDRLLGRRERLLTLGDLRDVLLALLALLALAACVRRASRTTFGLKLRL
mmetsp:Transcript_50449/g.131065  ORF Transcript_50449/g.131065 Transcript_50449/m.131065 type:complete len:230 (+) Transcript_50449:555-1244(+)